MFEARALPETRRGASRLAFFHPAKSPVSNAMHGFSIIFSSPYPSHPVEMYTNAGLNPPALPSSFPTSAPRDAATLLFSLSSPLELALLLSLARAYTPRRFLVASSKGDSRRYGWEMTAVKRLDATVHPPRRKRVWSFKRAEFYILSVRFLSYTYSSRIFFRYNM